MIGDILCPKLENILLARGLKDKEDLINHIKDNSLPELEEHFPEIEKVASRLLLAKKNNETVAICGDYDADGMTSTVLLLEVFRKVGINCKPFIPSREDDGYGLNPQIVSNIQKEGITLIITVDNGISAITAINKCIDLDIDLIITDHHKIPKDLPKFYALIHTERTPDGSPYKCLAGVGIAYILSLQLAKLTSIDLTQCSSIELFTIGTIADMAPIQGANRILLRQGLKVLSRTNNKALKAIIEMTGIDKISLTTEEIGFIIAPIINAVGRIDNPMLIIDLLLETFDDKIDFLARKCLSINKKRKKLTTAIEDEAYKLLDKCRFDKFILLNKADWHHGIIGIVAARVKDKYNLPTAILGGENDGIYRGSVRSVAHFKVSKALRECNDILESYGGHDAAGGFTVKSEHINNLRERLNNLALKASEENSSVETICPESHLHFNEIDNNLWDQINLIGPFGIDNPKPLFWTRGCTIKYIKCLKGGHLIIRLTDGKSCINAIKWRSEIIPKVGMRLDIVYFIEKNHWKGQPELRLNIIDFKKFTNEITLAIGARIYTFKKIDSTNISVTNKEGRSYSSNQIINQTHTNREKEYIKYILSLGKIAFGL